MKKMLSYRSRGTLISYTERSVQCCFKSNTYCVLLGDTQQFFCGIIIYYLLFIYYFHVHNLAKAFQQLIIAHLTSPLTSHRPLIVCTYALTIIVLFYTLGNQSEFDQNL